MTKLLDIEFDFEVKSIVEDSRKVVPGSIFVCIKGIHTDGHQFVDKAIENGASFIFSEHELEVSIPYKVVEDTQVIYSNLNAEFYNNPQGKMTFVGVTGTDGKTSTSTVLKDMLSTVKKVAYLGTNGLEFDGESEYLGYTTPPADILYKKLDEVASKHAEIVCMEASSMALDQKRCENLEFDVAIFTNLSHEHLDVHKTMEHYFESKAILFDKVSEIGNRIINIDDGYGKKLYSRYQDHVISYGIENQADFYAQNIVYSFDQTTFDLVFDGKTHNVVSPLIAKYNVYNLLSAIAACYSLGLAVERAIELIANIRPVDGRMHVYKEDVTAVVDFAHTPNSLEKLIMFAKSVTKGHVWVVFGSAGGRDHEKRPLMGEVASRCADKVIITNDDPRFEDPLVIMNEIAAACKHDNYQIIESRADAIKYAILSADDGDSILVTGKGNEDFQLVHGKSLEYNDIREVQLSLKKRKDSKEI